MGVPSRSRCIRLTDLLLEPLAVARSNANPIRSGPMYDVPADLRAPIAELNRTDAELFDEAKRLFRGLCDANEMAAA